MASRVDASDIVQEALFTASQRLPEYFSRAPYPFFAWLRQITWDRLRDAVRHHIDAKKRSVHREDLLGLLFRRARRLFKPDRFHWSN
jgi:RNA polymerase sigma-70 factor (ECF subfamily)